MPNYPYSFTLPPVNKQDIPSDGVVGEFLGISAGGVLDWLPVSGNGGSGDMLKADNLSGLADYAIARTNIGLGLTSSPEFANLTLTSPSLASSAPVTISQTWGTTGTYTAFKVVANETATANTLSNVLELWSGNAATLKLSIRKSGQIVGPSGTIAAPTYGFADTDWGTGFSGWYKLGTGVACSTAGGTISAFSITHTNIRIGSSIPFGWTSGTAENALDTILLRDGAPNTLALRNGANTQTFNVYGSYGSISDYKRLSISCDQTTGNATITNQAAGYTAGTVSINGVPVGLRGGSFSVAVGGGALIAANNTGTQNTGVGVNALAGNSTGGFNSAIGTNSFSQNTTGSNNIGVGSQAGDRITGGSLSNSICNNSVFLGVESRAAASNETNQIVIGYQATGIGSNSVVLGNDSITKTALKGNVGIGTTAPSEKLHVLGGKVLFGDATDVTGTSGNGDLTLRAYRSPQIHISANASSSVLYGLNIELNNNIYAGLLLNLNSGEVKIGGLSVGGYFPTFYADNVERMRITAAGNVGIGTTAPGSALHISGAMGTNTSTYDSASALKLTNTAGISWLLTSGVIGIVNASFCIRRESVALPALTIAHITDNVGIGTTSPTSKLHVVGDAVLTGQLLGGDYTVGTVATATQANISITNNHTATVNSGIVITPKGTGAFILGPKPDGTITGGGARGAGAVDLQMSRTNAALFAEGNYSAIGGGSSNWSPGVNSVIGGGINNSVLGLNATIGGGNSNVARDSHSTIGGGGTNTCASGGPYAFIGGGQSNTASATHSVVSGGTNNTASESFAFVNGGRNGLANRYALNAHSAGQFSQVGDAQKTTAVFRNKTTTNSAVELFLDGALQRYTVTSGKIISMLINITGTKSDGSAVAHYVRQYSIKNIGGTTSQVYAAVTVGTDNAAGTSIALSADNTNGSLKIEVTGVAAETWRWVASVDAVEVGHGV